MTAAYRMDLVERLDARAGGAVHARLVYAAKDALAAAHRRVPALRRPLTATSSALRRRLGWSTTYRPVELVATVPVTYTVRGEVVSIAVDLAGVPAGAVTEIVLMNELGAGHFDRYEDSSGASRRRCHRHLGRGRRRDGVLRELAPAAGLHAGAPARRATHRGGRPSPAAWRGPASATFCARKRGASPTTCASSGAPARRAVTSVLLIYPFFRRSLDRSRFRFPPLGPAYVAASLRQAGHRVRLLDCTFLSRDQALKLALAARADVVGVYCMATMRDDAVWFAHRLRGRCELLVAGGPLPTCEPEGFLADFDLVVRGEGEQTMVDVLAAHAAGAGVDAVAGAVTAASAAAGDTPAPPRPFARDLDALPFPARDLLPNAAYISHGRRRYGYAVTTVMSSRGCPFACEFCSNVVFGDSYRARSPASVVDEIEEALRAGLRPHRLRRRRVHPASASACAPSATRSSGAACASPGSALRRVDGFDHGRPRGCARRGLRPVFFGIESGSDEVLRLMHKRMTAEQARARRPDGPRRRSRGRRVLHPVLPGRDRRHRAGTLRFAGSLPLDYLGLSMPYPLPGTRPEGADGEPRDARVAARRQPPDEPAADLRERLLGGRRCASPSSRQGQFALRRRLGRFGPAAARLTRAPAEALFRRLP